MIEVYAGWAGRCNSILALLKRLKVEKDFEESCFVMLHCQAESHELLSEYTGMSMPHFMFYRNGREIPDGGGEGSQSSTASFHKTTRMACIPRKYSSDAAAAFVLHSPVFRRASHHRRLTDTYSNRRVHVTYTHQPR